MSNPQEASEEALIAAAVEEVLSRYARVIPPSKLDDFRRSLEFGLRTHAYPQLLLRRMRPRGEVNESGAFATDLADEPEADALDAGATKGKEGAR
jgi:hypothetical protein